MIARCTRLPAWQHLINVPMAADVGKPCETLHTKFNNIAVETFGALQFNA